MSLSLALCPAIRNAPALVLALVVSACTSMSSQPPSRAAGEVGAAMFDASSSTHLRTGEEIPIAQARDGNVEMVLTNRHWPDFVQARANAIDRIADGEPVFLHVHSRDSIRGIAIPPSADNRYAFSDWPHLRLDVRADHPLRDSIAPRVATCYLTLAAEDLHAQDLVVSLAPASMRPGGNPADCMLGAIDDGVAALKEGASMLSLRLSGHIGQPDAWQPSADLLAFSRLRLEQAAPGPERPMSGYRAMLAQSVKANALAHSGSDHRDSSTPVAGSTLITLSKNDPRTSQAYAAPQGPEDPDLRSARARLPEARTRPDVRPGGLADFDQVAAQALDQVTAQNARFVIHYQANQATAAMRARRLAEQLADAGGAEVELRTVALRVSLDNIRLFHENDRVHALEAGTRLGKGETALRDFSDYRPLPRPGTIEVWLASEAPTTTGTQSQAGGDQLSSAAVFSRR